MRGVSVSILSVLVACALTAEKAGAIVCHCKRLGPLLHEDCMEPFVCEAEEGSAGCFSEIIHVQNQVARRWGCVPAEAHHYCEPYSDVYNVTCCNGSDFCNKDSYPSLPGNPPVTTTNVPTPTDPNIVETVTSEPTVTQPSEPTTVASTVTQATPPSSSTSSSTNTLPTTQPATTSPIPAVPTASRSCYRSTSESPDVRLCSLQRSCFVTVRRHADNRVSYKRGCSPRNSLCVPEDRNRKIKICCSSSLCNTEIPTFGEAPDLTLPSRNNSSTHHEKNNPVTTEPDISMDPTDQSTLPVATETVPPETPPPTDNLPEGKCICDSCEGGYCQSTMGCATIHEQVDGRLEITQKCIVDPDICTSSKTADFSVECCKGELCNHGNNTIHPPGPTSVGPTTGDLEQTAPSTPTSDELGGSPTASAKGLSVYYVLTIVVGVISVVIAVVLLLICVYVCRHHQLSLEEIRKKNEQRQRTFVMSATPSNRTGVLA